MTRPLLFVSRQSSFVIRELPVTVTKNRIRVQPTRYGALFLGLLLALLLGSINYGNNLGFLFTFLLGSMALVSIGYTVRNLTGLKIQSVRTTATFAGQTAQFEIALKASAGGHTGVVASLPQSDKIVFDLADRQTGRLLLRVDALSRGLLRPGPLCLACPYPLGLVKAVCRLNLGLECLVYPKPWPSPLMPVSARSGTLERSSAWTQGDDDFQGLRAYIPGDALQRISWRASSRGQGLFTKDFTTPYGTALFLDWDTADAPDVESKLSILCSGVLRAHDAGSKYGLKLPSQTIDPESGATHRERCLKALALFSLSP